jgi:hypothetical protein
MWAAFRLFGVILPGSFALCATSRGQTLVEFTLVFLLFLVVAWIPADFGLAFYTGQLAQNASRDGARIAAADKNLVAGTTFCDMPCSGATGVLRATADRLSSALLPGARVTLIVDGGTGCDRRVEVRVLGQYNFFFYRLLRLMGFNISSTVQIDRRTNMRWEHQC